MILLEFFVIKTVKEISKKNKINLFKFYFFLYLKIMNENIKEIKPTI